MSVYDIDTNAVNQRVDWRSNYLPGPLAGRRSEVFPGDKSLYIVKDKQLPAGIAITGFLEAVDHDALFTQIETYSAMQGSVAVFTVRYKGRDFTSMDLAEFRVVGPTQAYRRGGSPGVKVAVRFTWQGVRT